VHTTASIDDKTSCSYVTCLLGACVPLPILLFSSQLDTFLTYSCLCSVVVTNLYGKQCNTTNASTSHNPWLCLSAAHLLMTVLILSSYHNCSVTTRDGHEIPLRDALHNMLVSPAWVDLRHTLQRLLRSLIREGMHRFIYELRTILDPEGESSAYRVKYC